LNQKKKAKTTSPTPANPGPEARTAPRFGFEGNLPYRVLIEPNKEEANRLETQYRESVAKNISLGGLCMKVDEDMRPGTLIEVQIPSVFSDGAVSVQAQVMWCDMIKKDPYIGVAFQSLTDEASVSIQKLIRQLG